VASYTAGTTGTITFPWQTYSTSITTTAVSMQRFATACTTAATTWQEWVRADGATAWTYVEQPYVWDAWQQWHQPVMRSAEEEQAHQDRLQAQREERSRRLLAEKARLEGAQERAMVLLEELVAADDWVPGLDLIQVVGSDGELYRIELHRRTVHGNIVRVDEHGCILGRACVAPSMIDGNLAVPMADGWVGQYLGLKFDAEQFLSHANWSETHRGCQNRDAAVAQHHRMLGAGMR
jgi:hypothetical protein